MSDVIVGIVGLLALLMLFLTNIELSLAMGIIGFLGFSYIKGLDAGLNLLAQDIFDTLASYGFTVLPLFILMGQIALNSGTAKRLYDVGYKFMGHIPGGLAMATVAGATVFKAICGSSTGTAATFASVAVPEMERYGYSKKLSTGIVASVGTLGILVPPSATLIVIGVITEQSIGRLFLAGLIPGLMIALFFVFIIYGWCKINPSLGPKGGKSTWKERMVSLPDVMWALLIFLVVIGGLMQGFFTPTEAGSVGTFAVLMLSLIKKDIDFGGFIKSIVEASRNACMILMLIVGSTILGHFLAASKIPFIAADWILQLPLDRNLIMILIALTYLLGGSFIDDLAFMVLATPIFYPVIISLGFSPIWFAMIISVTVMVGIIIPPVAINVFVVKNITGVPLGVIYSGVYPFLISLIVAAVLLFIYPQIALFLPSVLMR